MEEIIAKLTKDTQMEEEINNLRTEITNLRTEITNLREENTQLKATNIEDINFLKLYPNGTNHKIYGSPEILSSLNKYGKTLTSGSDTWGNYLLSLNIYDTQTMLVRNGYKLYEPMPTTKINNNGATFWTVENWYK